MFLIIAAAVAALAVVVIVLLKWSAILDWFRNRTALKQSDKDNIAFTLQEKLSNGYFKTVEGIFNKKSNELLDGKAYESEKIDSQLAKNHRGEALVVYN